MSREFAWTEVAPRGHLYTYTTVRRVWLKDAKVPFSILQVSIDDAPGVILICNLGDENAASQLRVGMPVWLDFRDMGESASQKKITLPFARLHAA